MVARKLFKLKQYLGIKNQQDALFCSQFISIINIYMFRAGLLLIIMRYFSVCTAFGKCHALMLQIVHPVGSYLANISRITVHKTLNLQSVVLTFSYFYVLRFILDIYERNHYLDLEETNTN